LGNARSTLAGLFTGDDDEDVRLAAAEALQKLLEVDKGNGTLLLRSMEALLNDWKSGRHCPTSCRRLLKLPSTAPIIFAVSASSIQCAQVSRYRIRDVRVGILLSAQEALTLKAVRFPNLLKGLASSLLQAAMRNEGTPVQRAAE